MFEDCVDDYSADKFSYSSCTNNETEFKCEIENSFNFGKCYNLTSVSTSVISLSEICNDANNTIAQSIGYWKSSFPSQDYWR